MMGLWRNARPGSVAWLLAHECRMFFYDMVPATVNGKAKRGMPARLIGLIAVLALLAHVVVWKAMRETPALVSEPSTTLIMGTGVAMFWVFTIMLSMALTRSVTALFERGDLDLLLSSPLSSRTIFSARLAGIVLGVSLIFLLVLAPIAHVGLLLGQPRWLGIYPAVIGMATLASASAMLLTLALVKWLGVRRTLTTAQVLAALCGAAVFLIFQLLGNTGHGMRERALAHLSPLLQPGQWLGPESLIWLPARTLFGSPSAMLGFSVLSAACFWLTARFTHDFFIHGVQQAGGMGSRARANTAPGTTSSTRLHFRAGVLRNILVKEWRSIARDLQLISQILLQLLYLLPMFFIVFKDGVAAPTLAAGFVLIAASLAGSLTWIIVSAEDAPDLLLSAPVKSLLIRRAKLLAAVLPVAVLFLLPLAGIFWLDLRMGLLMLPICGAAMGSAAMIQLWHATPGIRSQFARRTTGQSHIAILEVISHLAWAGTMFVGGKYGWWILLPLTAALITLGVAWLFRTEK